MYYLQTLQLLDAQKYPQSGTQNRTSEVLQVVQKKNSAQRSEENLDGKSKVQNQKHYTFFDIWIWIVGV